MWPGPHFLILKCDTRHSLVAFSASYLTRVGYELATLPYLYSLRMCVIAHVTTCGYQRVSPKSKVAVSDSFVWQFMTFRELDRGICEL